MEVDILKYQKHELLGKKFGQLTVIEIIGYIIQNGEQAEVKDEN